MTKPQHLEVEPQYWRSVQALLSSEDHRAMAEAEALVPRISPEGEIEFPKRSFDEFAPGATDVSSLGLNRRRFNVLLGASMALASGVTSGCMRKPQQKIVPLARRPEDRLPGEYSYYATSAYIGGTSLGLRVASVDGRPTKIEGNPEHPMSFGGTSAWAQASVLDLYDPVRARNPQKAGADATLADVRAFLGELRTAHDADKGAGLAILTEDFPSPTYRALLAEVAKKWPEAKLYEHDLAGHSNTLAAAELLGVRGTRPLLALDKADVVLALDADFLAFEGDAVRAAKHFGDRRRTDDARAPMNRLYVVEANLTATGAASDHRLRLGSAQIGSFLRDLAATIVAQGVRLPEGAPAVTAAKTPGVDERWLNAVAKDLVAMKGRSLIVVGERQPAAVHALACALNVALGNVGSTVTYVPDVDAPVAGSIADLAKALGDGKVKSLLVVGGNPAYDAPADLDFRGALAKAAASLHLSVFRNETSAATTWHVARSHFLETWGDLRATDGTVSPVQPLLFPLHDTISEIELLAALLGKESQQAYDLVRAVWSGGKIDTAFERLWHQSLHDGVRRGTESQAATPTFQWAALSKALESLNPAADGLELAFVLDPALLDGRYAGNAWLQELPDPVTKLTWDNAALVSRELAQALGVENGDFLEVSRAGRSAKLPVWITPGIAPRTVVLPLGYGRTGHPVAKDCGFDVGPLRTTDASSFAVDAQAKKAGGTYLLVSTQDHGDLEGRPIVREATLAQYREDPKFAQAVIGPPLKSLFEEPHKRDGLQWGMSIDLGTCTGCNACVMACQAENNIPVVGKDQVANGREMHWIRLDRYFSGSAEAPSAVFQPMPCQQCENAPCETVCPVGATAHSPEGLNDMAYNRCIGTRYCSNNCPYKVRRFNYFNFNHDVDPMSQLQKNPNVTVRFRGVMEKCTYCVQRIQAAKIAAKRGGSDDIADGTFTTACAQACPSKAIVFGNINDPKSEVVRRKRLDRDYTVLAELNNHPRTTYLARIRNPNPELG